MGSVERILKTLTFQNLRSFARSIGRIISIKLTHIEFIQEMQKGKLFKLNLPFLKKDIPVILNP